MLSDGRGPSVVGGIAGCVLALAAPDIALAQGVDEIVVTARKRDESLQDVPLSISALTGQQLVDRGVQDNFGVALFTPNFNTSNTLGRDNDRPVITVGELRKQWRITSMHRCLSDTPKLWHEQWLTPSRLKLLPL